MHAIYWLTSLFLSPKLRQNGLQNVPISPRSRLHQHPIENDSILGNMHDGHHFIEPLKEMKYYRKFFDETMSTYRACLRSHPSCYIYLKESVDTLTSNYYKRKHDEASIRKAYKSATALRRAVVAITRFPLCDDLLTKYEYHRKLGVSPSIAAYNGLAFLNNALFVEMESSPNWEQDHELTLLYKKWTALDALLPHDLKEENELVKMARCFAKDFYRSYVDLYERQIDFQ